MEDEREGYDEKIQFQVWAPWRSMGAILGSQKSSRGTEAVGKIICWRFSTLERVLECLGTFETGAWNLRESPELLTQM
jgi:hypothetical protein